MKRYKLLPHSARLPYPKGKQRRKVRGCALRLERVLKGELPQDVRPYVESSLNALKEALKSWE